MSKPTKLRDLLTGGHISMSDVHTIARSIFDGETTMAGPEGYIITAVNFNNLAEHIQGFITKGILEFKVENVLDIPDPEEEETEVGGDDGTPADVE